MQFIASLPATDLERAKQWYAKTFELEPTTISEGGTCWYESGGGRFMLYESQFAGTNQATAATLLVDDVAANMKVLKARGATFEDYDFGEEFRTVDGVMTTPDGQQLAWLKDSEGNILALAQSS
jgi:predicted enzyme related to lactoylglutathione lyase